MLLPVILLSVGVVLLALGLRGVAPYVAALRYSRELAPIKSIDVRIVDSTLPGHQDLAWSVAPLRHQA